MIRIQARIFWLINLAILVPVFAAAASQDKPAAPKSSGNLFSFLAGSMQKNPTVDFNVVTELTASGKIQRQPSDKDPVYYVLQPGLYHSMGEAAPAGMKPPAVPLLERWMKEALASSGLLEAAPPDHAAALLIVFNYGDHLATFAEFETELDATEAMRDYQRASSDRDVATAKLSGDAVAKLPALNRPDEGAGSGVLSAEELVPYVLRDPLKFRQLIERAGLVGGSSFAKELSAAMKREQAFLGSNDSLGRLNDAMARETERGNIDLAQTSRGAIQPQFDTRIPISNMMGPFRQFQERDAKTRQLVEDSFGSCYFVIVSAFDYAAFSRGERRLLWRSTLTVNASGISMDDGLPELIHTAAPHFGKATEGAITLSRKISRDGQVEAGPAATEGKSR